MTYTLNFGFLQSKNGSVENKQVFLNNQEIGLYSGEIKDGKMSGKGQLTINKEYKRILTGIFIDGSLVEGEIKISMHKNRDDEFYIFNGKFTAVNEDEMPDGKGIYKFKESSEFHGEFIGGKINGFGISIQKKYLDCGTGAVKKEGFFNDGYLTGKGNACYTNGTIYEGEFGNYNKRNGYGICKYSTGVHKHHDGTPYMQGLNFKGDDGFVYEGEWHYNKRHGKGILKDAQDNVIAEGIWENNKLKTGFLHARDVHYTNKNDEKRYGYCYFNIDNIPIGYEGEILDFKIHGNGKSDYKDGSMYEGDFEDNKKVGENVSSTSTDEIKYEKTMENDKNINGMIEIRFNYRKELLLINKQNELNDKKDLLNNGTDDEEIKEILESEIKDLTEEINGLEEEISYSKDDVYIGETLNNLPHGKGKMIFQNYENSYEGSDWEFCEEFYDGDWCYGLRHGKGKMQWAHGNEYEGDWLDDTMHGNGVLILKHREGFMYEGEFKNNQYNGFGKYTFLKDYFHEGGNAYWWENYEGYWLNGKQHGEGKLFDGDGNLYFEGSFKDGLATGYGKTYILHEGGQDGFFLYGTLLNGKYMSCSPLSYDENGAIIYTPAEGVQIPEFCLYPENDVYEDFGDFGVRVNPYCSSDFISLNEKVEEFINNNQFEEAVALCDRVLNLSMDRTDKRWALTKEVDPYYLWYPYNVNLEEDQYMFGEENRDENLKALKDVNYAVLSLVELINNKKVEHLTQAFNNHSNSSSSNNESNNLKVDDFDDFE